MLALLQAAGYFGAFGLNVMSVAAENFRNRKAYSMLPMDQGSQGCALSLHGHSATYEKVVALRGNFDRTIFGIAVPQIQSSLAGRVRQFDLDFESALRAQTADVHR